MAANNITVKLQVRLHGLKYKLWLAKWLIKFRMNKIGIKLAEYSINSIEYKIGKDRWRPLSTKYRLNRNTWRFEHDAG